MWKFVSVLLAALLGLSISACTPYGVWGSGNVVSETRNVSGFTRIQLDGPGDLTFTQGAQDSLTVQTDDNILPLVTSDVRDGELQLGLKGGQFQSVTKLVYTVTVRDLSALTTNSNSVGTITGSNINTDKLTVRRDGGGHMTLSGMVREQNVTLAGAGDYNGEGLRSETAVIVLQGANHANVSVSNTLDATIESAGTISYRGDPHVTSHISGAGTVTKASE